jgi:hypothetical protein
VHTLGVSKICKLCCPLIHDARILKEGKKKREERSSSKWVNRTSMMKDHKIMHGKAGHAEAMKPMKRKSSGSYQPSSSATL